MPITVLRLNNEVYMTGEIRQRLICWRFSGRYYFIKRYNKIWLCV